MKQTLRSVFEKLREFVEGEPPMNYVSASEFKGIEEQMRARGCKLQFAYTHAMLSGQMNNLGFVTDEKTSVYEIMHAEGNLEDVFSSVTGRPLDRKDIKHYRPEDVAPESTFFYPGMF